MSNFFFHPVNAMRFHTLYNKLCVEYIKIITGGEKECAYSFAEVTCGDISALFVFRVAAPSTSVDRHTWWFIEDVGRSPELPAHIDTHFSGHALSLPPFHLYTCIHTESKTNTTAVNRSFFSAAAHLYGNA